jgi:hypothetical protein
MALFRPVAVPAAGGITALWLGLGGILYFALFAGRAEAVDAFAQSRDPTLAQLRGRQPLVLVPIANPASAPGLVAVANALAPREVGKVILLSVLRRPERAPRGEAAAEARASVARAQEVLGEAMAASLTAGHAPEGLLTVAEDPWREIARAARRHRCESLVLGLSDLDAVRGGELERLLNEVDCEVVVVRAPAGFDLRDVREVLVPIGGRGQQDEVRARLLGSLAREGPRRMVFCGVLPPDATEAERAAKRRLLAQRGEDEAYGVAGLELIEDEDVVRALIERAGRTDLVILGLQRHRGQTLFGEVSLRIAAGTDAATLMISRRG